jgi:hypothetical protein
MVSASDDRRALVDSISNVVNGSFNYIMHGSFAAVS